MGKKVKTVRVVRGFERSVPSRFEIGDDFVLVQQEKRGWRGVFTLGCQPWIPGWMMRERRDLKKRTWARHLPFAMSHQDVSLNCCCWPRFSRFQGRFAGEQSNDAERVEEEEGTQQ